MEPPIGEPRGPAGGPGPRVHWMFRPVLWLLGGRSATEELTPQRAAVANAVGFLLTALLLALLCVAVAGIE